MNAGILIFLVGLYVLPLGLLGLGHHLKRRSARAKRIFWGAVIGHCLAGTLALFAGMMLPEEWTAQERMRGFLGLWSLLIFPLVGGIAGALKNR
jgi:uncharacterized membrane protein HdeD (DUF308 family)